jgi:hypothetical protein
MAHTQQSFNQQQSQFNPFGFSGPGGGVQFIGNQGFGTQSQEQQGLTGATQAGTLGFLEGAQNVDLSSLGPAFNNAQNILSQQAGDTAFGNLGGQAAQAGLLSNLFAGQAAQGPQDIGQQFLFGQGQNFLNQAGDQSGLIQQSLDASRALAAPFEQQQRVSAQNSIFNRTGGATTGSRREFADLLNSQSTVDQQRIMDAQQLGLGQQQRLGNLGISSFGQGANLFGQSQGQFNNQLNALATQQNFGAGVEGQAFQQMMQALGQNQTAGQSRLQNAMSMFGLGEATAQDRFQTGLAGQGALDQTQGLMQQLFLGAMGADADRISAQADFAPSNADLVQQRGDAKKGFFSSLFSDARLKDNITRIGRLGDFGWYEWDWNDKARDVGADKQPNYGVIAQEVQEVKPDAVSMYRGYLTVNYQEIY